MPFRPIRSARLRVESFQRSRNEAKTPHGISTFCAALDDFDTQTACWLRMDLADDRTRPSLSRRARRGLSIVPQHRRSKPDHAGDLTQIELRRRRKSGRISCYRPSDELGESSGEYNRPSTIENTERAQVRVYRDFRSSLCRPPRASTILRTFGHAGRTWSAAAFGRFSAATEKDHRSILNTLVGVFNGATLTSGDKNKSKDGDHQTGTSDARPRRRRIAASSSYY